MPIKAQKLGTGTLTIGATGSPVDFSAQVTKVVVTWDKEKEDNVPVLSGEELEGDSTYTAKLTATLLQDFTDDGIVDWSWQNKGSVVPFEFEPNTEVGRSVTGMVTVDPIDLGGDVKKKNTSDIEWDCVGEPAFGPTV
jgi:hypothetical protein